MSPLRVALNFVWQSCCYPALAATRNSKFMCDKWGEKSDFHWFPPAFLAKHCGSSHIGASKDPDPRCSKEGTMVLSFSSGFSMFFVVCQVQDGPSGNT